MAGTGAVLAIPCLSPVMWAGRHGLPLLLLLGREEPADAEMASSLSSDLSTAAPARWVLILARLVLFGGQDEAEAVWMEN